MGRLVKKKNHTVTTIGCSITHHELNAFFCPDFLILTKFSTVLALNEDRVVIQQV